MPSNYLLIDFLNKKLVDLKKKQIDEYKQKSEMIIDDLLEIPKAELYTNDFFISDKQVQKLEAEVRVLNLIAEDMTRQMGICLMSYDEKILKAMIEEKRDRIAFLLMQD